MKFSLEQVKIIMDNAEVVYCDIETDVPCRTFDGTINGTPFSFNNNPIPNDISFLVRMGRSNSIFCEQLKAEVYGN